MSAGHHPRHVGPLARERRPVRSTAHDNVAVGKVRLSAFPRGGVASLFFSPTAPCGRERVHANVCTNSLDDAYEIARIQHFVAYKIGRFVRFLGSFWKRGLRSCTAQSRRWRPRRGGRVRRASDMPGRGQAHGPFSGRHGEEAEAGTGASPPSRARRSRVCPDASRASRAPRGPPGLPHGRGAGGRWPMTADESPRGTLHSDATPTSRCLVTAELGRGFLSSVETDRGRGAGRRGGGGHFRVPPNFTFRISVLL